MYIVLCSIILEDLETVPAFSAHPSANHEHVAGELVQFDVAISNLGGYYQPDNSVFICPFDGVYVFSLNALSQVGYLLASSIYIDNQAYVATWADNVDGANSQASNMYVGFCAAGSQAWAQVNGASRSRGNPNTVFAGFLLQRYEQN